MSNQMSEDHMRRMSLIITVRGTIFKCYILTEIQIFPFIFAATTVVNKGLP